MRLVESGLFNNLTGSCRAARYVSSRDDLIQQADEEVEKWTIRSLQKKDLEAALKTGIFRK